MTHRWPWAALCTLALGGWLGAGVHAQTLETVELVLPGQPAVVADIHRPAAGTALPSTPPSAAASGPATSPAQAPRGAVILVHGFTRSRTTLGGHAAALAEAGLLTISPDMPHTFDFRRNAAWLAALVQALRSGHPHTGGPVPRVVLLGFSAGALSSLLASNTPGVVGYIGLDAFDKVESAGALGLSFAPQVQAEALLLRAPPSRCNAESVSAPWGGALPRLWEDRVLPEATHCDFESPTDWICRLACGAAAPDRQAAVRRAVLQAVERWLGPATAPR